MWQFSIRSTERARHETSTESSVDPNPHLRAGFLAVQVAITRAIIAESTPDAAYEVRQQNSQGLTPFYDVVQLFRVTIYILTKLNQTFQNCDSSFIFVVLYILKIAHKKT